MIGSPKVDLDIAVLEAKLQEALKPVEPRTAFVRDLRQQLVFGSEGLDEGRRSNSRNLLVIFASVLGGTVLLIFGARRLKSMLPIFGRLNQDEVALPVNPV